MDQSDSNASWIEAYTDWTDADSWTFGPDRLAGGGLGKAEVDVGGDFVSAYLDWMDAWQLLCEAKPLHHDAGESGVDMLWDALMVALHTDSDCMPFLRRIIEASEATPSEVMAA